MINQTSVERKNCPPEYPDEVLYSVWLGMNKYCDCSESEYYGDVIGGSCPETGSSRTIVPGCTQEPAISPVVMSDLGGFKVCGIRNSPSFIDAVRAMGPGSNECADP